MILTLEVVGPQASILGDSARKTFVGVGGTIGRSNENDWVIPDSYISGTHARIHFRNDRFFIVDSSANGTSLKSRANRLTKGQWYALSDMDRLFLDMVEVRVSVESAAALVTAPIAVEPTPVPVAVSSSKAAANFPEEQLAAPRTTPLAMPTDAVLSVLLGDRDLSSFEREFLNSSLPAEEALTKAIEQPPPAVASQRLYDHTTAMFTEDSPPPADAEMPRTVALNLTGTIPPETQATTSAPQHQSSLATGRHEKVSVDEEYSEIFGGSRDMAAAHTAAPAALLDTMRVKSLLSGAGIPSDTVTPELTDTLTHILRVCIQGLLELQQQREAMKDAFHLSVTKFKSAENNPLRFSANVEDALYNLLVKRNPAYLQPAEAVTSSFKDAQWHQTAMANAMRVAYFQMMAQFDPQQFNAGESKRRGLFGGQKNTSWEQYSKQYAELRKQADGGFSTLFGDAFSRAYQEELDRLRQQS